MRYFTRRIGFLLLALFLILWGLSQLFGFTFSGMGVVLGLLALIAGILILFER